MDDDNELYCGAFGRFFLSYLHFFSPNIIRKTMIASCVEKKNIEYIKKNTYSLLFSAF